MAVHYPEKMRLRLPRGMPEALALAAGQHHTTPSEWVRQALLRSLQADGVCIRGGMAAVSDRRDTAAAADLREAGQPGGFLGDPAAESFRNEMVKANAERASVVRSVLAVAAAPDRQLLG